MISHPVLRPSVPVLATLLVVLAALSGCSSSKKKAEEKPAAPAAEPAPEANAATAPAEEAAPVTTAAPEPAAEEAPQPVAVLPWGYSADNGPANWAKIDPLFSTCAKGKRQSPIDLRWKKPVSGKPLQVNYKDTTLRLIDVGHTIQINVDPGSQAVIGGVPYDLMHIHIRTSSEHTLSGNELPMELQFLHKGPKGQVAIISTILIEGAASDLIDRLWSNLPTQKLKETSNARFVYNPTELIPPKLTHYTYSGSLTYPPCTEGVTWVVLNTPITGSGDQILAFRKLYSANKRPIQPLNGRKVVNH